MKNIAKAIVALFFIFCAIPALADQPLLQEGKKSVYQRLVTHPGAVLYSGPEAGAAKVRDIPTFSMMYIYGDDGDRFKVGSSSSKSEGWIDKKLATEWPQAITMVFTDRTGRDPVLFFRDHKALEDTCLLDDVPGAIEKFQTRLADKSAALPDDYPVIASEPIDKAVAQKNFYLLPVLSIDDQFYDNQGPRLIEVASINPGTGEGEQSGAEEPGEGRKGKASDYRTGFVFVIDTTISMKPYIDQTVELIRNLYDELEKAPHANKMAFAVVAFRSDVSRSPGIEYTAKIICDFTTVENREELEKAIAQIREATVSTHDINEDSFAGVKEAADNLSWEDYGSRVMALVTDAGPLGAGDPSSSTGFSPESLAEYLKRDKIYLTALHILNPKESAKKNQSYARDAYRILTKQSDNMASYIPIDATTPAKGAKAFNNVAKELAESYSAIAKATAEGKLLPKPQNVKRSAKRTPEEEARRIAESTGYAMQLQFFGDQAKTSAPDVIKAWITDADMAKLAENPNSAPILAVEPAALLTKGQLSNLYKQLKLLLESSEKAFLNGDADLFDQIASAAAQMSRDPQQYALHPDRNLAENGLLDEVLEGLPYKSVVGSMTRKNWEDMSVGQRDAFIRRIKGLLKLYEDYDKDVGQWENFGSDNPNDAVYRVRLSALP